MEMHELEVWVVVDESGDYVVAKDQGEAAELFENEVGGSEPRRQVKVTLRVPAPKVVELVGEVPAESNSGSLVAK